MLSVALINFRPVGKRRGKGVIAPFPISTNQFDKSVKGQSIKVGGGGRGSKIVEFMDGP